MASAPGPAPLATGCYRCGRTGHWGKDCPFNQAGTPGSGGGSSGDRPPSTASRFSGSSGGGRFSNSGGGLNGGNSWEGKGFSGKSTQGSKAASDEPIKTSRKRPMLTADLLLSEKGLGYVLEKMPEMVTIKGREDTVVRDLMSLLEGYMHWHSLLLPYFSFDQFVEKLEFVGAKKRVRVCFRELRDKIVYGKESTDDKDIEVEANEGSSPNDTLPKDTPAGPGSVASHGPPYDIFTNEEPELPVNEVNDEDFEDFFRQGTVETSGTHPSSNVGGGSAPPGLQSNASPVRKFPSLEDEGSTVLSESATSITISESAAARMEANRLQALERAKARQAKKMEP